MITRKVKLNLQQGLHIRACSQVVSIVTPFSGILRIRLGEKAADANSMFDLVQLAAVPGSELLLEGDGEGVEGIMDALEQLFSRQSDAHE